MPSQCSTFYIRLRVRGGGCAASILGDMARDRSPVKLLAGRTGANNSTSYDILTSLSHLDDRLVERLRANDIRLLRISWLCGPSVTKLQRRQLLEEREREGESPFLSPEEAVEVLRRGNRGIAALTYGWLSPGDPDPAGHRLQALRAAFAELPYLEGLFWDYGSLPQHPRDDDLDAVFRRALSVMADVYASAVGTTVL